MWLIIMILIIILNITSKKKSCPCTRHAGTSWTGNVVPLSLNLCIRKGEWSAPRPYPLYHRQSVPGTHSIGGWVGYIGCQNFWRTEHFSTAGYRHVIPLTSSTCLVTILTELSRHTLLLLWLSVSPSNSIFRFTQLKQIMFLGCIA